MITLTLTYFGLAAINFIGMVRAFVINFFSRRAGIVDVGWAACMVVNAGLPAASHHYLQPNTPWQFWVLPTLFVAWYSRLGLHLLVRYSKEQEEDSRYAAMRKAMGGRQHVGFFVFFMLQVAIALFFSYPLWQWAELSNTVLATVQTWFMLLLVVWVLIAGLGQAWADRQLSQFKAQPTNQQQVMQSGLWRYSRHPNYFFEWMFWLPLPVLGAMVGHPEWVIYPILMFVFLRYLTGIPFSEKQALLRRGERYRDYQQRTSAFFLWPAKPGP